LYVENLTVRVWSFHIFPRFVRERLRGNSDLECLVFDASVFAFAFAFATKWIASARIERVQFRITNIRDDDGNFIRLRVTYCDLSQVQRDILNESSFREFVEQSPDDELLPFYLAKVIAMTTLNERHTLTRALLIVRICAWLGRSRGPVVRELLILEQRPWFENIRRYAAGFGLEIADASRSFQIRDLLLFFLSTGTIAKIRYWLPSHYPIQALPLRTVKSGSARNLPVIGVQHRGHLNLDRPELYSDLFFWQNSSIPGNHILAIFWMPQIPVDQDIWDELARHKIQSISLDPRCPRVAELPVFVTKASITRDVGSRFAAQLAQSTKEQKWLRHQLLAYRDRCEYWTDLFERLSVKIHVTWYWADGEHVAVTEALRRVGGVSSMYQRSLDLVASSEMAICTDVFFGFSNACVARETQNGSQIRYAVTTGYVGGHRFPLLREEAEGVRRELEQNGATSIMAFFDEDSADERWDIGYDPQRQNYAFLLEKVCQHKWFGLILKPKLPRSLPLRLGPVAELLTKAVQTGRCFVFEGGPLEASFPPAVAAMAADVAVNGHLCAPTAGLEAALAGVPTLLMDREGWHVSPLYGLGEGRVVFKDWNHLWEVYCRHRLGGGGVPGFGAWSPMLEEFDSFRDGRAAERMGQYLHWILVALQNGVDRETAMADAAERYCRVWGLDKIRTINSTALHSVL
jgi:hypothetical protein